MKILIALLVIALLAIMMKSFFLSFRAQQPGDYGETTPAFVLAEHLAGPILAEGMIYGPTGRMTSTFTARMEGRWSGETGILSEDFTYSTGRRQLREWRLMRGPGNTFTATADDIVGEAQGVVSGSTVRLTYRLILPEDAGGNVLDVIDWLYLLPDGTIMNKSEMRKFGLKVAELVATMRPQNQN